MSGGMIDVLYVGIRLLLQIILGFILCKFKFVSPEQFDLLNYWSFRLCFIGLLMRSAYSEKIEGFMPFAVGTCINFSMQILFLFCLLLPTDKRWEYWMGTFLPVTFANYIIIGIPVFNTLWGDEGSSLVPVFSLSNDVITTPTFLIYSSIYNWYRKNKALEAEGKEKVPLSLMTILKIFLNLLTNSIIIGDIIGFAWVSIGLPKPLYVSTIVEGLANAASTVTLLCCGAFIAQRSIIGCHWAQLIIALFARFIIMPLVAILYSCALGLSNLQTRQINTLTTLATSTVTFVLASNANIQPEVSATLVLWTLILCIPFVMLWKWVLDSLHLFEDTTT